MKQKLVIVESPAKARTLSSFLDKEYLVKASVGHVRDLPKNRIGINLESFEPEYFILQDKKALVKEIKEAANASSAIYLATDPDREGEAISWHLVEAARLNKDNIPIRRIVFHEITKEAIEQAIRNPRDIDMRLVNAQQARRILDRIVGYKLSPLLWKKVQRGLSAGRVQSVAVRLVAEREAEIDKFKAVEYWLIEVELEKGKGRKPTSSFVAKLAGYSDGSKLNIPNETEKIRLETDLSKSEYMVRSVNAKESLRQPAAPFITSTLQQEAWRKLHFAARHTMTVAQQLYEGLPLGGDESIGLITYMRTDSFHLAASAVSEIRDYIKEKYGDNFVPDKPRLFTKKQKFAQEAHEAIRPTSINREPLGLKSHLSRDQFRLYELIWQRALASQMSAAKYMVKNIETEARYPGLDKTYALFSTSSIMVFPGFSRIYIEGFDEEEEKQNSHILPEVKEGEKLKYLGCHPQQFFTQPPPRLTEATLIKALEHKGIGRPSTYASIISTIQDREYVHKEKGRFRPDRLGIIVNDLLVSNFPQEIDYGFTAIIEKQLDEIAKGERDWVPMISQFYNRFSKRLEAIQDQIERVNYVETSDEICSLCQKPMVVKRGRFGKFLACSGYPDCRTTMPFQQKSGALCPKCGGDLVMRLNKAKRRFYGCSKYPECKFITNYRPYSKPCPACGKLLVFQKGDSTKCLECGYSEEKANQEENE